MNDQASLERRSSPWTARTTVWLLYAAKREYSWPLRPAGRILRAVYRVFSLAVAGIDLPLATEVGSGLQIHHGFGLVVNPATVLGRNITLRQGVTIGARNHSWDAPQLNDGVDIGPNAVVLGAVTIGCGTRIGAGAIVLEGTPPHSVVVGTAARIISSQR